ncbi:MAG: nucleotide sugar dehydrogenase [Leptospirales bacterium]
MSLDQKIASREVVVGIMGCGYVGLPLALEFAKKNFHVLAFDLDIDRVAQINRGVSYIPDVPTHELSECVTKGLLEATSDFSRLSEVDTVSICVPTPLRKTKDPDISYIMQAVENLVSYRKSGQLIILESTTYPGTTREMMLPALAEDGRFEVGLDFYLAFSPERVDPGNPKYNIVNTPKVVGGITEECTRLASMLYGAIVETVIPVSSTESAEMVKLLENTFRSVNIGLVNELALMSHNLNVNIWEIIDAAASKPFGFMPFYPGPGLGGHCIPIDPHYLSWKARQTGFEARFIELAGVVNSFMPHHVVNRVVYALNEHEKCLKNARILVVGVAYKKDVNDLRESPALDVMALLEKSGAILSYSDPYFPELKWGSGTLHSVELSKPGNLKEFDLAVVITNHSQTDYKKLLGQIPLIVDTRNVYKNVSHPSLVSL